MSKIPTFVGRISDGNRRKDDLTLIVDSSALINMAALIDPTDVSKSAPDQNPTLQSYLVHLGQLGVKVVIPESVIFESCGHTADGEQLTRQFEGDTTYPYLVRFLKDATLGKIKNVSIIRTPFAEGHLNILKGMKDDFPAFNQYRKDNLSDFADHDIETLLGRSRYRGQAFVVTNDKRFAENLKKVKNPVGRPVGVVDFIKLVEATQRVAPIDWMDDRTSAREFVDYVNHARRHETTRREATGRIKTKGPEIQINPDYKGTSSREDQTTEPDFDQALYNMIQAHQQGR